MFRERLDGMGTDILVRKAVSFVSRQALTLVELRLHAKLFQCGRRDTRVCAPVQAFQLADLVNGNRELRQRNPVPLDFSGVFVVSVTL
jgi:hypothetical protein